MLSCDFTCPDKQNVILAVLSFHSIHCQLLQVIFSIRFHQDWLFMGRFYGLIHQRMRPCETNGVVRVVFGGPVLPSIHLAGTLKCKYVSSLFSLRPEEQTYDHYQEELDMSNRLKQ